MLPNGWKKVKLGDVAKVTSGGTPLRTQSEYWNGNIPWVKTAQIQNGYISKDQVDEYITELGVKESSAKIVPKGTLLMAMYGQGKTRGQVAILDIDATINQACAAFHLKEDEVATQYLFQYFLFNYENIRNLSNDGGQKNLSAEIIKKIPLDLPPIEEQKKIAATLSVWDSAIEKMEKLIEFKESQKKFLIKKLIEKQAEKAIKVGNVTIDKNKWKHERIGNVLKIGHGRDYKGLSLGKVPVFGSGGYMTSVDKFLHDGETVCIGRKGTIDKPFYYKGKIWTVDTLFYTYDFKNVIPKFIYYVFCSIPWKIKNEAGGVPSLTSKIVENVEFYSPSLPEQQIIVDVLSNADDEISLLKQQLENYKKQKQGLMQKLLTGQWRVK